MLCSWNVPFLVYFHFTIQYSTLISDVKYQKTARAAVQTMSIATSHRSPDHPEEEYFDEIRKH